jgi:hypothetical protein
MLLTVGHAIDRAKEEGMEVRMNIGGEWVSGRVMNSDGHGVAVLEPNGDMCVVRRDAITCVRLESTSPACRRGAPAPCRTPEPMIRPRPRPAPGPRRPALP